MQDGAPGRVRGMRRRHEPRGQPHFCLATERLCGSPVGGTFWFQIGNPGGSPDRARKALNAETIAELHKAFRRGGAKAIDKVMKNNPAMFLKLLVLLVPREIQVEQSGGVKAMTDEQLERGIELIQQMLAQREAGANAT